MPAPIRMSQQEHASLDAAQAFVTAAMFHDDGATCPCCGGGVKVKRYSVSARQARELAKLAAFGRPTHWREWLSTSSRMQCVLRYAGLIYQPTEDTTKPFDRSGIWDVTPLGHRWLLGEITIPKFIYVVFKTIVGRSDESLTYADALQNDYQPEDAMRGAGDALTEES